MPSRDIRLFLEDILDCCAVLIEWTATLTGPNELLANRMLYDAVMRNVEIVGEAAKNLPSELRDRHRAVDWRGMAGLRDVVAHAYFGISSIVLWDILRVDVPLIKSGVADVLAAEYPDEAP